MFHTAPQRPPKDRAEGMKGDVEDVVLVHRHVVGPYVFSEYVINQQDRARPPSGPDGQRGTSSKAPVTSTPEAKPAKEGMDPMPKNCAQYMNTECMPVCVICSVNIANCAILSCGHVCCPTCFQRLEQCHICRKPIGGILPLFFDSVPVTQGQSMGKRVSSLKQTKPRSRGSQSQRGQRRPRRSRSQSKRESGSSRRPRATASKRRGRPAASTTRKRRVA